MFDENGNVDWVKILLSLALVFAIIGGIGWVIDTVDRRGVEQRIANDMQLADQTAGRVSAARTEWSNNNQFYADHWSAGLNDLLTQAENDFASTGVYQDLDMASQALAAYERSTAKQYLTNAETRINQSASVINQILGPPDGSASGLYQQLADWSTKADGSIADAQICLGTTQVQLLGLQSSVNYAIGLADLVNAQTLLDQAIAANTTQIERGIVDKPQAYRHAQDSLAFCSVALAHAAPPPPTQEPPPPQVIIIDNSDSDDDSTDWWSSDSGSDDSGWDSGGSDWSSDDSGSWDSGGWDSGSDSGWDSGGSDWSSDDSGSWDSGGWDSGSDSGSWDSDW